jgi:hypothetical protein
MYSQHSEDGRTPLGDEYARVVARKQSREPLSHAIREGGVSELVEERRDRHVVFDDGVADRDGGGCRVRQRAS